MGLLVIHPDSFFTEVVTQEFDGGLVENALFCFQEQGKLSEPLKYLGDMMLMVRSVTGEDENIINIHENKVVQEFSEDLIHETLEHSGGVYQAIRHHQIFVVPCRGDERRFPLVSFSNSNQVICAPEVQFGEYAGISELF